MSLHVASAKGVQGLVLLHHSREETSALSLSQAIGATAGAYLVQHLEPHNLQFAIATSLLVVFILMVCPLAKLLKRFQDAQARRLGARQPLLPGNSPEGVFTSLLLSGFPPLSC